MGKALLLFLILIFWSLPAAATITAPLPQTGQTGCWDDLGNGINCSATGQDGEIRAGVRWPKTRFVDNGNGTITDNLTGLAWLKNANCFGLQNWYNAILAANNLANGSSCGLTDGSKAGQWRLPNRIELESLLSSQQASPALPIDYPAVILPSDYWTSSSYAPGSFFSWQVNMGSGLTAAVSNFSSMYTLPVRDAQGVTPVVSLPVTGQTVSLTVGDDGMLQKGVAWPSPRFSGTTDTVTDNLTGLVWAKDTLSPGPAACTPLTLKNWHGALAHIKCLNSNSYLGATDWRLPNRRELASLINLGQQDNSSWLKQAGFSNIQGNSLYWGSTTLPDAPLKAWGLVPATGTIFPEAKLFSHNVWPVRGGVLPLYGNIDLAPGGAVFGSLTVGEISAPQVFTLGNTGKGDLKVSSITIAGGSSTSFAVNRGTGTGGSCGTAPTIPPKGSCTVSVTFKPVSAGNKNAVLRVVSDDPDTPLQDAPLGGIGLVPVYTVSTGVVGGHGDISCTSPVTKGGSSFCTITPESGYELATFTDNGFDKLSLAGSGYVIAKIAADHAISGSFSQTPPAVDGGCGSSSGKTFANAPTLELCASGTASAVTGSASWSWSCAGLHGGQTVTCTAGKSAAPLLINGGATYTTTTAVSLTVAPPAGETLVRLGKDGVKWGKWLPVLSPMGWKLPSKDGAKSVFAQFRNAGDPDNGSYTVYSDSIILDGKAPTGTMRLNGGVATTNSRDLTVSLTAIDTTSGVEGVCLKEDKLPCNPGEFIPFAEKIGFTLQSPLDGKKTVYATLRDLGGKLSKPLKGSITLDTAAPSGTIVINGGKPTTPTALVALKLTATKATQMQLSTDGGTTWGAWEKFAASKKITLPASSGVQTVSVRFLDGAGNLSADYSASIEVIP